MCSYYYHHYNYYYCYIVIIAVKTNVHPRNLNVLCSCT